MDLDFYHKFKEIIGEMQKLGEEYAEAKGQSWQLQELSYSILAEEMKNIKGGSIEQRKIDAKNTEGYRNHIIGTAAAIKKEHVLKARYEGAKAKFEAYRSLSSLEKATRAAT